MEEHLLRFNKDKELVFIDFETCNLNLHECHDLPWQVCLLNVKGEEITSCHNFYIKWPFKITVSPQAAQITGYDAKKVEETGVDCTKVASTVRELLERADKVIGHNLLGFDNYICNSFMRKSGLQPYNFIPKLIDTACVAKGIKLGIPYRPENDFVEYQYKIYHKYQKGIKYSLGVLGKEFGIPHDSSKLHDAEQDLRLNFKIWNKLKYQIDL